MPDMKHVPCPYCGCYVDDPTDLDLYHTCPQMPLQVREEREKYNRPVREALAAKHNAWVTEERKKRQAEAARRVALIKCEHCGRGHETELCAWY